MMNKKAGMQSIIVIALAIALSFYLVITTEAHSDNIAFCNIQGRIFNTNNNPLNLSQININCTLDRNNSLNTTYETTNGNNFPSAINNSYRCAMICTNISLDTVEINFYNTTHETYNTTALTTSTKFFNFTLLTVTAPIIYNISGNISATTGDIVTIEINAADNINVTSANITLNNGTTIIMTETIQERFAINITPPNNTITEISYIIKAYDRYLLNATSNNYTITVSDNDAPTANAGQTIQINESQIAQFNSSNSSDNIGITSYLWNFNVINNSNSTLASPTYNFTTAGTYNVSLLLKDAANNNATAYVIVVVVDSTKPTTLNTFPSNNSNNIPRTTNIIINFSKALNATILNNSIFVFDASNNLINGELFYNTSTNATTFIPSILLKQNETYKVNITTNAQDTNSNNISNNYVFNFTTKLQDTDNDGIADINDTDKDNDGIINANDKLNGNASTIYTNIGAISITINNSVNVNQQFQDIAFVRILNNSQELLEFYFNFSNTTLDLTNLTIYETNNKTTGELIINGLNLAAISQKKTVFITNKSEFSAVCIKDAEIETIANISSECTASNEYKIECNGASQNGYACAYNATIGKYKITGLSNSGVKQINYTIPAVIVVGQNNGGGGGGTIKPAQFGTKNTSKAGDCKTNLDCADEQECAANENICAAIICSKGYIQSHFCINYECAEDSDCSEKENKICYRNKCRQCATNNDCGEGFICQDYEYTCKQIEIKKEEPEKEIIKELTISILEQKEVFYTGEIITIQVHDNDNNPIADTKITLQYKSDKTQQVKTDNNGKAQIKIEEEGTITISAAKQGFKTIAIEIQTTEQSFFAKLFQNIETTKLTVITLLIIILSASILLVYYMIKPIERKN
ncbi:Ig-like domain-containing protein [Candidatus Woesearchaeota archaeon]|nr:Ig-like domain-containing protein [Candidatus Woesearchaeota archaeon]